MASATVTQTLKVLSQAAAGDTIMAVIGSATVSSSMSVLVNEVVEDAGAVVGDSMLYYSVISYMTEQAAVAGDSMEDQQVTNLRASATAGNTLQADMLTLFAPKGAEASSKLTVTQTSFLNESATAGDSQQTLIATVLHASAYASSALTSLGVVLNETLSASARASGAPAVYIWAQLTGSMTASDSQVLWAAPVLTLTGSAVAGDSTITIRTTHEQLTGSGTAGSAVTFNGSVLHGMLTGSALAAGSPWAKDLFAVAWVLNTETGGLATYDNFQFTSMAEYGGIIYATSSDGVFALVGDSDVGRPIAAELKTGFLDFGRDRTKRLSDVYIGYTGGQLELDAETYDQPQEVYTYPLEEREAIAPRNNRLKIGKGLSSRYWRFAYRNIDGADFQVYDVSAEVATSKRRL